jgi:LEA14-like dessication related protein
MQSLVLKYFKLHLFHFILLVSTIFLSSCELKEINLEGMEDVKVEKVDMKEAIVNLSLKIKNENWFKLKVKPSVLDVSADGKQIGKLYLQKKVKIKGKKTDVYTAKLKFEVGDGGLMSMMPLMLKESVNVNLKGKVKGGVFIFSKKMDVSFDRTVNPKELKSFIQ